MCEKNVIYEVEKMTFKEHISITKKDILNFTHKTKKLNEPKIWKSWILQFWQFDMQALLQSYLKF